MLQAHDAAQLAALLPAVQEAARQGAWCVGGLTYEAASALRPDLHTHPARGPLAWFAIYADAPQPMASAGAPVAAAPVLRWHSGVARPAFDAALARIHDDIAAGRYYQLNLTQQDTAHSATPLQPQALFAALQRAQPGGYGLYLNLGAQALLSASPELFFDWHQPAAGSGQILTRPMKGTATRGGTPEHDAAQAAALAPPRPEERAENVMIVDLLRNDLGQIAEVGQRAGAPAVCRCRPCPRCGR